MKPELFLKKSLDYEKQLRRMKAGGVKAGITQDKATSKVYGNGWTVLQNGIAHEFGYGVPERSFIRLPFRLKRDEITDAIDKEFNRIIEGKSDAEKALNRIGLVARNISVMAFRTEGYGNWPAIEQSTAERKGSSKTLIDKGILRGAISWEAY